MIVLSRLCSAARLYQGLLPSNSGSLLTRITRPPPTRSYRKAQSPKESRQIRLNPEMELHSPNEHRMGRSLIKCSIFAAGFCASTFTAMSIWQYETVLRKVKIMHEYQWPEIGWRTKSLDFRNKMNEWWNNQSDGQRVFWPICFANMVVYGLWRIPSMTPFLMRYFAFSPAGRAVCLPMLLSTFSHYNILHLAANMYVVHSFSTPVCRELGKEQFLGLYLCSGVLSSLGSAALKVLTGSLSPSLGASGAIMGILAYFCSKHPESKLGIIFIPQFSFSAASGLTALICLDSAGVLFGWRLFDHAAHLSGALSGLAYGTWGHELWAKRKTLLEEWHRFRQMPMKKTGGER